MRFERRESRTLRRTDKHRFAERPDGFDTKSQRHEGTNPNYFVSSCLRDQPSARVALTGLESNAPVAGADFQELPTIAELALERPAFAIAIAVAVNLELVPDRSVAGMRVEVGAEVRRQVERDPAVAGGHRPVVLH